jgi:hypothetical protein
VLIMSLVLCIVRNGLLFGGGLPVALRTTSIPRPEDGTWKVVHRHADPITTAQPVESVVQQWTYPWRASGNSSSRNCPKRVERVC